MARNFNRLSESQNEFANRILTIGRERGESIEIIQAALHFANAESSLNPLAVGQGTIYGAFQYTDVRCEKDGVAPGLLTAKSSTKGMAFGNILFGGIIGAGVDISTGAAYDYPICRGSSWGNPVLWCLL